MLQTGDRRAGRSPAAPARPSAAGPGRAPRERSAAPACRGAERRRGGGLPSRRQIRHTGVVKISATADASGTDRTRDCRSAADPQRGPQDAATLAGELGLTPAAIRRHLDALVADGLLAEREPRPSGHRGRGRPARTYALTDAGRAEFPHAYDDLANTALRYLRDTGGDQAVAAFAAHRADTLAAALRRRHRPRGPGGARRVESLAGALTVHGYAATTEGASGRASRSASTTARSRTSRRSSPSCARPRPGRSSRCSAPTFSGWRPSPTATGYAPPTSRSHPSPPPEPFGLGGTDT